MIYSSLAEETVNVIRLHCPQDLNPSAVAVVEVRPEPSDAMTWPPAWPGKGTAMESDPGLPSCYFEMVVGVDSVTCPAIL